MSVIKDQLQQMARSRGIQVREILDDQGVPAVLLVGPDENTDPQDLQQAIEAGRVQAHITGKV